MPTTYALKKKAGADVLDLEIYDIVGDLGLLGGGVTAKDVLAKLGDSEAKEIQVRINSAGGSCPEGLAIYNLLRERSEAGTKVRVRIDGLAASIASVIAMAGDEIEIASNAFLMIHEAWADVKGRAEDLRRTADLLDDTGDSLIAIYAERTRLSEDRLRDMCRAETWLTANEALELGFADRVISRKAAKGKPRALATDYGLDRFKSVPLALLPKGPPAKAEEKESRMDPEEIEALKAELAALKAENDELKAKLSAKAEEPKPDEEAEAKASVIAAAVELTGEKDLARLEGALMALTFAPKTNVQDEHIAKVNAAIKAGKLAPARKDWALRAKPETFAAYLEGVGGTKIVPVNTTFTPDEETVKALTKPVVSDADKANAQKIAHLMGVPLDALITAPQA